ncbi:MAG: hypothetical protein H0T42_21675 [Deltaproteobacteria bacterium]|nr:hypothetical protein [Deltaproteobacteria bacterium]
MPAYRDDLEALSLRQAALATEVAAKTRELAAASDLLADAKARARLPVLDNIRVATPCSADWAKMTGDERVRVCGDCTKSVYNLSDMTRDEAQALIVEKAGKLCVRYFQRADGTILLKDCSIGVKRRRRRVLFAAGAAALLAGVAGVAYHAATDAEHPSPHEVMGNFGAGEPIMGEMAAPEVQQPMRALPAPEVEEVRGDVATPELYAPAASRHE